MDDIRCIRKPAILIRGRSYLPHRSLLLGSIVPVREQIMKLTKINRAATIAIFNSMHTEIFAVPTDEKGCDYLVVRRQAARLFGIHIRTADLFSIEGNASRIATEIVRVASIHGWIANSASNAQCSHTPDAFDALTFSSE